MKRSRRLAWVAPTSVATMASLLLSIPAAAAQEPEVVSVPVVGEAGRRVDGGGSDTMFAVDLPSGASCPGDSKDDEYRVNTYMVPLDVDPASLQFAGNGPEPQSYGDYETFRMPLFDTEEASVAARLTAEADSPGQPGEIIDLPYVSLAVYEPGFIPEGAYNVGVVCNRFSDVTNVWNAEIVITQDAEDEPAHIHWEVVSGPAPSGGGVPAGLIAVAGAVVMAAVLWRLRARRPNELALDSKEPR